MKRRARAADELLAGRAVNDGRSARRDVEVERLFGDMRSVAEQAPAPRPNAALVAVLDGGRGRQPVFQFADDTATRDTSQYERSAPLATLRRWLRPAIVPSAAAAILLGGLAGAGALPAPVQHATAHVLAHFGLSIPGDTHHNGPVHPVHPTHPSTQSSGAHGPGASHRATASPSTGTHTPSSTSAHHRTTVTSTPPSAPALPGSPGTVPQITVPGTGITVPRPGSPPTVTTPSVPGLPKLPTITVPAIRLPNLPG